MILDTFIPPPMPGQDFCHRNNTKQDSVHHASHSLLMRLAMSLASHREHNHIFFNVKKYKLFVIFLL